MTKKAASSAKTAARPSANASILKIFARELLKLPAHQYPLLPIDETLQAALVEGKRLSGNALSRHLNYLTPPFGRAGL